MHERRENGAVVRGITVAARTQRHQLAIQITQCLQAPPHMCDVLVQQRIHLGARLGRRSREGQQLADLR
jgi:hypothetical protein